MFVSAALIWFDAAFLHFPFHDKAGYGRQTSLIGPQPSVRRIGCWPKHLSRPPNPASSSTSSVGSLIAVCTSVFGVSVTAGARHRRQTRWLATPVTELNDDTVDMITWRRREKGLDITEV